MTVFTAVRCLRTVLFVVPLILTPGCGIGPAFVARHEPWREDEERACLSLGLVRESPFVVRRASLGGPDTCGAMRPFAMEAAMAGRVRLDPPALLRCPMVPRVDAWVTEIVEPAARTYLGARLTGITVAASYSCRARNNEWGGRLSEHGYANALDISAFRLANGRAVSVRRGWAGNRQERVFLRAVHRGACGYFTTVLGPDHDELHEDHFHFDLARHGAHGVGRICK